MTFTLKPDYDKTQQRIEAFFHGQMLDRPPVSISLPAERPVTVPSKTYATHKERWLDVDFRSEQLALSLENRVWAYDALPIVWPNLGPEIFSAWCGCPYEYGETTTWSEPCIHDWESDEPQARLDMNHPLFRVMERFTQLLIERGKGRFIVGLTDFHPGGDHVAALRDPQNLATDMIDNLERVKALLPICQKEYYQAYDYFYDMIRAADMPATSWIGLTHPGRYYIPSNDFSCMISKDMFDDVFLPGIVDECRFYERSIYHLDGPGALRHLPSLLAIPELNAVQWVCGAGNEGYRRWIKVYQQIQAAHKGVHLGIDASELPLVFETLKPEGVWFAHIGGIKTADEAETIVKRIERWK